MDSEKNIKIEQVAPASHIESGQPLVKESIAEPQKEKLVEVTVEKTEILQPPTPVVPAAPQTDTTDNYHAQREIAVDNILSDGLSETFLAMSPDKQKIFKEEGEKTAKKINVLLDATKINVNKIINLVRKWLSIIPGINRFFLDQEAKIKTDNIIKIKNKL
ncbi:MAG: hypothetical protein WAW11_03770 [Patescibacteria group bacterium]